MDQYSDSTRYLGIYGLKVSSLKTRIYVLKLTSCSGCLIEVLSTILLNPDIRDRVEITRFDMVYDPVNVDYVDIAFIEGSVVTSEQVEVLKEIREKTRLLIALGSCSIHGGLQSIVNEMGLKRAKEMIYINPSLVETLDSNQPVSSFIKVDLTIPGCPVNGEALASILRKLINGAHPVELFETLCMECKRKGIQCLVVSKNTPCLGPLTIAGCGAICPSFNRGCIGCYGLKTWDIDSAKIGEFMNRFTNGDFSTFLNELLKGFSYHVYQSITSKKNSRVNQ